jgi:hypothetical protein
VPTPSASPTASPLAVGKGNNPSANRATTLLAKSLLSQQPYSVVGEDCSLPTTCACCWQRIFIFSNFEFKLFLVALLHCLQAHG